MTVVNGAPTDLLRICREITIELRQCPGAKPFNDPIRPDQQSVPNYFRKVKNPQDLGSILDRLNRGEYTDVKNWERDINTVWTNAQLYNGKDSFVAIIAQHMQSRFRKLTRERLESRKTSGWMKLLSTSRQKLDRLLLSPPSGVGPIFPVCRVPSAMEYAPFSNRELDALIDASRAFFKPDDLLQIAKILQGEAQTAVESETFTIHVDDLSPKSLHKLRDYFKKTLSLRGQVYPT
jgi:hypothetical protein